MPPSIGTHGGGQQPGPPLGGGGGAPKQKAVNAKIKIRDKNTFEFILNELITTNISNLIK